MKRITTIGACALSSLALLGAANAGAGENGNGGRSEAAKDCAAQKKADKQAFKALYGKHAMRNCIKGEPVDPTPGEFKNAAEECRDERSDDVDAFRDQYGTNNNKRNALGKCVSEKVKHSEEADPS